MKKFPVFSSSSKLIASFLFVISCNNLVSQDDMLSMADNGKKQKDYVYATFKSTRNINFHTCEVVGRRSLDFRISHRFGSMNSGTYNAWGLDQTANVRLGLEYSPDGRFMVGIGRSSYEKMTDGFVKFKILRQTSDNRQPVTITWFSSMYCTWLKDDQKATTGIDRYAHFEHRLSYVHQLIIGRKFGSRFSLQVAPAYVHYNLVQKLTDKNDLFLITGLARFKVTQRIALTFEYAYRLNNYSRDKFYDSMGAGIDIETGGHVFQVHVVNSFGMCENQYFMYTNSAWNNVGIRLGFNISRVFAL
ncbi:MAG: hypothetical protein JST26_14070 [Bacteroidetes bacterium]|nr:hypothetical protein [Bacteroidota bacterium]